MEPPRKACDLCYRKKIKCDGQIPRCSPCVVYNSDCTFQAASRKTPSRKQATTQRHLKEDALQSRVKTLEDQLSVVLEKVERLERLSGSERDDPNPTPVSVSMDECGRAANQASGVPHLELPPDQEVIPIIKYYLATFNSVFPLFHSGTLLQAVRSWYHDPHSRDPVLWAMINVVLALAYHTSRPGDITKTGSAETYLNNVQLVLTQVIMRETTLMNVQILLGMVILFWTADDLRPALVLIATALRLAHRLGYHNRASSKHLSQTEATQQNRVFWIAYILDRDMSLESRLAPVQLDSEIDLDLPPLESQDDHAGFIFAPDGRTKMNFFRARIELARIQGKVYDCVYSASAQRSSSEEKSQNITRVFAMLNHWSSQIPSEFSASNLSQANMPVLSRYFCILYSARLSCRALVSFASNFDSFHYSRWIGHLQDYGGKVATGQMTSSHAPVPQGWQILVEECREYMKLSATVIPRDNFFVRRTLCAYNSGLISLTANRIFDVHCRAVELDIELTRIGMLYLEDVVRQTDRHILRHIRDSVLQLCSYADLIFKNSHEPMWSSMSLQDADPQSSFSDLLECHGITDGDSALPFDHTWAPCGPSAP
ncbi:fungal-specific transcription factor domain-containing protein [Annulohypoxylon moriforme]|nr:fungal-specific transcription factor domain-containing protein [Annulohypoxylon moriforme]